MGRVLAQYCDRMLHQGTPRLLDNTLGVRVLVLIIIT